MSAADELPTLADLRLRRGPANPRSRRSAPAPGRSASSSLFDLLPADLPAVPASSAEIADDESVAARDQKAVSRELADPKPLLSGAMAATATVSSRPVPAAETPRVWTVPELVRRVRGLVEQSFDTQVAVEGEISNWRPAGSGHCYFTLKGGEAQLSAVIFRTQAVRLTFRPKDGDAVRLRGQLSVYESRGQMQMVVASLELAGLGAQLAAVQELKNRLRSEGLFDRKRKLPAFPKCIGVITSLQGAALRDLVKVCRRRHAAVNLLVYPAAVQGPRCPAEVMAGLRWFNAHRERVDVVLLARGGGSWEDLHGFDDEGVARAIAGCAVPVVVGVGHATDSTIADAAADLCAPTPSAAAELLTAAQHKVEDHVLRLRARVTRAGRFELLRARQRLLRLGSEAALRRAADTVKQRVQRVDEGGLRLETAARRRQQERTEQVRALLAKLQARHPGRQLRDLQWRGESLRARLFSVRNALLAERRARIATADSQLGALSPLHVLQRGYALVYGEDGSLLRGTAQVAPGSAVRARLASGSVRARVEAVEP